MNNRTHCNNITNKGGTLGHPLNLIEMKQEYKGYILMTRRYPSGQYQTTVLRKDNSVAMLARKFNTADEAIADAKDAIDAGI